MNDKEFYTDLIFGYFNRNLSEEEMIKLDKWMRESEEHRKIYRNARKLYEAHIMTAPIESLDIQRPSYGSVEKPSETGGVAKVKSAGTAHGSRIFRNIAVSISSVAAAVAIFFGAVHVIDRRYEKRFSETMNTIVVPAGKSMDYILPDGTIVKLNSGARFSYPMMFAKDSRKVSLDGEAYFEVTHNPEQPFIVKTFASDITVLGTKFNVKADEAKELFTTTLVEGSVKLTSCLHPDKEIVMKPDQTISLVNGEFVKDSKSAKRATLWTNGIVSFSVTDFRTLADQLRTSFGVDIIIERDIMLEVDCLQGEYCVYDGIECVLNVLKKSIDFTYTKDYSTGTIYIK